MCTRHRPTEGADSAPAGRICNECGAHLPRETESGSPILMAHLRTEHPERLNTTIGERLEASIRAAGLDG